MTLLIIIIELWNKNPKQIKQSIPPPKKKLRIEGFLPDGHGAGLDEILEAEIVNAAGGEDNVGARGQDLVDTLLGDIGLTVPKRNISYLH